MIGSGGKVIREIVEKTGAKIDISDDGTIKVASADGESIRAALKWIKGIVAEPEVGEIYEGKIVKIMDFGAFVNFFGPRDGLVHISELAPKRVAKVSDVVKEGDMVKVKLIGIDDRGKVRLSMKVVDQATGKEIVSTRRTRARPRNSSPRSRRQQPRGSVMQKLAIVPRLLGILLLLHALMLLGADEISSIENGGIRTIRSFGRILDALPRRSRAVC